jgi:Spy/CpxP family protein refolding chaperone
MFKQSLMKKLMSTIGIVAILFGSSVAQDAVQKENRGKGDKAKAILNEIPDLTAEQRAELEHIIESVTTQAEPFRQEMKKIQEKIVELKSAENPDAKEIDKLVDEQAKIKAEIAKIRTTAEIKSKTILSPEQSKILEAKMKEVKTQREKKSSDKKQ